MQLLKIWSGCGNPLITSKTTAAASSLSGFWVNICARCQLHRYMTGHIVTVLLISLPKDMSTFRLQEKVKNIKLWALREVSYQLNGIKNYWKVSFYLIICIFP